MTDLLGTSRYTYDDLNRLTMLTDPANHVYDFVYDAGSRLTALGYPNGTIATYAYDAASQLLAVTHQQGANLVAQAAYTYDQVGNRASETRDNAAARSFGYDANDRVLSAQSSNQAVVPTEAFAYDQAGNWMTDQRNHNAANALTDDILYSYIYDEDGNLIEKRSKSDLNDVTTYTWDALNRLTKARTATTEMAFDYDAFGRRAIRTETPLAGGPVKTTRFVYDGANVRLEVDGNGALLAANTHAGLDRLLGRNDYAAGASYYVHADGLGSTIALTDAAGQVVERYAYSAFGQLQVLTSDFQPLTSVPLVPYTYTGRDWEPKIGLYNYRARYYSPTMGRFISVDPIGFAAGDVNLFSYVGNNPISKTDPLGLQDSHAPNSGSFNGQLGPLPTVYLRPGIVPQNPINDPPTGTRIQIRGYGTVVINEYSQNQPQHGRVIIGYNPPGLIPAQMALTYTPYNSNRSPNVTISQWVTSETDPNAQQTPYFDGEVTSPDFGTNQTSFNDRPQTCPGQPVGFAIFIIDPTTGKILQQINWQNTGTGQPPGTKSNPGTTGSSGDGG